MITGPRGARWHAAAPSTLVWAEALDGGDLKNKVPYRDRRDDAGAPFAGEPSKLVDGCEHRLPRDRVDRARRSGARHRIRSEGTVDAARGCSPSDRERRLAPPRREMLVGSQRRGCLRRSRPQSRETVAATCCSRTATASIWRARARRPKGDRPFLDRLEPRHAADRAPVPLPTPTRYEPSSACSPTMARRVLTQRELEDRGPELLRADAPGPAATSARARSPAFNGSGAAARGHRQKQCDPLQAHRRPRTVRDHLHAGRLHARQGVALPTLLWAYPQEFTSARAAAQVKGSPNRFTRVTGAELTCSCSRRATRFSTIRPFPIVGARRNGQRHLHRAAGGRRAGGDRRGGRAGRDRSRPGRGGRPQLRRVHDRPTCWRTRISSGWASRAAGRTIASLTPFGFQAETRTFWEVPQIYEKMSPFWYAQKINEPILLIHGEADNNSGHVSHPVGTSATWRSRAMGATARYVTLPHESHGYVARESLLHTVAEMLNWADRYLKQAAPRATPTASALAR